jgi:hypothetical protein
MSRRALACAILVATAVLAALDSGASAQSTGCPIALRIASVLAANTNEGVDSRLTPIGHQLVSTFHYTTYRLVSAQNRKTTCGRAVAFELPGGRILGIDPLRIDGGMIAMQLVLFQGERLLISADVKLNNRGVLMVGGPSYQEGMLITSIRAESPALADRPR